MLYTKYRPQKFSDLQNLDSIKKTLLSQLKQGRVGHAYLFAGPKGTGKTTTARLLAKAINCEKPREGEPCLSCENCEDIQSGRFLDLVEIDAASNRGIDDVRTLREKVKLAPVAGRYKIYIIDEAHMLTKEAFNALLKTLEEPPKHVIFVLCTTEPQKILPTVTSRCQRFTFKRASIEDIKLRLQKICSEERTSVNKMVLEKIALAAGGGYRDAETLLEQVITGEQTVESLVGSGGEHPATDFIESLSNSDTKESLLLLNKYLEEGLDLEIFTKSLINFLRDLLFIKIGIGEKILDEASEDYQRKEIIARKFSEDDLDKLITLFTQAEVQIRDISIPQLPLELAVIRFSRAAGTFEKKVASIGGEAAFSKNKENEKTNSFRKGDEKHLLNIKECWEQILQVIRPHNHSIEALLKSCTVANFDGEFLTLKTYYKFHKERLESQKNRLLLEQLLSEFLNSKIRIRCILGNKEEMKNLDSELGLSSNTLDVFSGELF